MRFYDTYQAVSQGFQKEEFRSSHSEVFFRKGVYGKTPMLCNFIEITFRHGCSAVNLLHISRTTFLKNTSGWLLLEELYF